MSWFRRKTRPEPHVGDRTGIERMSRVPSENDSISSDGRRAMQTPELPRGIDAGFCWGDEQKR